MPYWQEQLENRGPKLPLDSSLSTYWILVDPDKLASTPCSDPSAFSHTRGGASWRGKLVIVCRSQLWLTG